MNPRIAITLELSAKGERCLNFLDLAYAECVERAGGLPLYFPSLPSPTFTDEAVAMIDGVVLTGGADIHPSYYGEEINSPITLSPNQRTDFDIHLFRASLKADKPILAICHGMQIMNVALGGSLIQDIPSQVPGSLLHRGEKDSVPARHKVTVEPGSRLADLMRGMVEFEVSSTHHQAVKTLGRNLQISARAPDGIVEGIELPDHPKVIGIQWHPEKDPHSEPSRRLFQALVEMARKGMD
jgi:putative glutamine amidotransferase